MDTSTAKKHDWGMFFMGILLVICAFVIMAWPGASLVTMSIVTGMLFLVAGVGDIINFNQLRKIEQSSGWMIVNIVLDFILGVMFVAFTVAGAETLPFIAGCFVIMYGVMAIVMSIGLKNYGSTWILLLVYGILSIPVGIFFMMWPGSFIIFLGVFLIMRGCLMCFYGIVAPRNLPYLM